MDGTAAPPLRSLRSLRPLPSLRHPRRSPLAPGAAAAALLSTLLGLAPGATRVALAADPIAFKPPVSYPIVGVPGTMTALDLDGDGKLDLSVTAGDRNALFYGKGDGTFEPAVDLGNAVGVPEGIGGHAAVADMDGDGDPDLIVGRDYYGTVLVFKNLGGRTYAAPVAYPIWGSRPLLIATADFTGDGKPDVAVSDYDTGYVHIFPNNGDGSGTLGSPASYWTNGSPGQIVARDFNGDGKIDWAARSANFNCITVYLGDGAGNYEYNAILPTGTGAGYMLAGDFTGDGKIDLISAEYWDGGITFYQGNGDGSFIVPTGGIPINQYPLGIGAADLDGDGNLDVVAGNAGTGGFSVLRNTGGGAFEAPVVFEGGDNNPRALAVGDFNGDGQPDVALANEGTSLTVLINDTKKALTSLSVSPASVIGGDAATGTVTLGAPAPAGGALVTLSDTLAATSLPASVMVPAGQTSASFTIPSSFVSSLQSGTVTASYRGVSRTSALSVRPVALISLELIPNPVKGGKQVSGQVTLDHAAGPGGLVVQLTSSNVSVAEPTSGTVTIGAGKVSATFTLKTKKVSVTTTATITASANGSSLAKVLTVTP
jgi:hypothetical protein